MMKGLQLSHWHALWPPLALCGLLLAGCGGGTHSSLPPAAATAAPLQAGKAHATFRIDVPKNAATANKRSAQYVSPATTQMAINIEQSGTSINGYPVTVGLTPTSGGCSSTLANTYCQLSVVLAPGNYMATLTTEDVNNTPLSSAQSIAFTITAGANNLIPITLSGIPYALQVSSGAIALHGSGNAGFKLYGSTAQPMIVTALDADGNIIAGPGSPTYSASVVSGSGWSAAAPASTAPNTIAVTPPGSNGSGATFSVTASYSDSTCSQSGAVCSTTFTIKNDIQTLFVANLGAAVTAYASPYTGTPTAISNGVSQPYSLVLDGNQDLFVANFGLSTVTEYAPPYSGAPVTTVSNGISEPSALAIDAAGNLYVADFNDYYVFEFPPPYTTEAGYFVFAGEPANSQDSIAIALDDAEHLWVSSLLRGVTWVYALPFTGPTNPISGQDSPGGFVAIVVDGAGNVFLTGASQNVVYEFWNPYPSGQTDISTGVTDPESLAVDGAGNLFVGNYPSSVTVYAPPYTGTPTTITNGVNDPRALAVDGAGNLFVANFGSNTVTEYVPPYTGAPVATISGLNLPYRMVLTP